MTQEQIRLYLSQRFEQLISAIDERQPFKAMAVLNAMHADGHTEVVLAVQEAFLESVSRERFAEIFGVTPEAVGL